MTSANDPPPDMVNMADYDPSIMVIVWGKYTQVRARIEITHTNHI